MYRLSSACAIALMVLSLCSFSSAQMPPYQLKPELIPATNLAMDLSASTLDKDTQMKTWDWDRI